MAVEIFLISSTGGRESFGSLRRANDEKVSMS
jgi:hypothetical protein